MSAWLRAHVSKFDLVEVHAVFSHASLAAGRACRLAGVPYVVRPLGTLDPWSLARKRTRKQWLMRVGGRDLLTGAAAMHYTSQDEMRLAEAAVHGLPTGFVVAPGVEDAFFEAVPMQAAPGGPYVLALARLHPKKGLDLLIRAFHALADDTSLDTWRLVIAGDGDPELVAELRTLADSGPARARIDFRGWVEGEKKVALVRGASLFALPSHQENFGISVAEAMAAAVPVVVTPGVNLAPAIDEAGAGWVVERDLASVTRILAAVMRDEPGRTRRGEAARGLADRFRWSEAGRQLGRAYDVICREHGSPRRMPQARPLAARE